MDLIRLYSQNRNRFCFYANLRFQISISRLLKQTLKGQEVYPGLAILFTCFGQTPGLRGMAILSKKKYNHIVEHIGIARTNRVNYSFGMKEAINSESSSQNLLSMTSHRPEQTRKERSEKSTHFLYKLLPSQKWRLEHFNLENTRI